MCICKSPFDTEYAISVLYPDIHVLLNAAHDRLNQVAATTCMQCEIKCIEINNQVAVNANKYTTIKILQELNNLNAANSLHVMCKNCLNAKTNNVKKKKEKVNSNGNYTIYCNICHSEHYLNKATFEATFKIEEICKCIIF